MTRHLGCAIALVAILTMVLAAMPLAGAAQDTVDDRKVRCRNGGWQTLARADGTPFANQGECVSPITSEGGTFAPPFEPTTVSLGSPISHLPSCIYSVTIHSPGRTARTAQTFYESTSVSGHTNPYDIAWYSWVQEDGATAIYTPTLGLPSATDVEVFVKVHDAQGTVLAISNTITCRGTDTPPDPPVTPTPPPSTDPSVVVTPYAANEWGCEWSLDLSGFPGGQEVTVYADQAGVEFDPLDGNYVEPFTMVTDADGNAYRSQAQASVVLDGLTSYVFTVSQGERIMVQHTVYCGWNGNEWIDQG